MKNAIPTLLLTLGTALLAAPLSSGAMINWGSAMDVASSNDVSTIGTPVEAFNLGYKAAGLSTVTVNSVTFTAAVAPAPLTSTSGSAYLQLNGSSSGDTDYDNLLNSVAFGGGTSPSITLGGGSLINGQQYEIQIWFTEERSTGTPALNTRVMTYGDGNGNTVGLGGTAGLLGQYAIGSFTADGATQSLTMVTNGFGNAHLTAYQIRAVPEPAAAVLIGLAGGLVLRRRR